MKRSSNNKTAGQKGRWPYFYTTVMHYDTIMHNFKTITNNLMLLRNTALRISIHCRLKRNLPKYMANGFTTDFI